MQPLHPPPPQSLGTSETETRWRMALTLGTKGGEAAEGPGAVEDEVDGGEDGWSIVLYVMTSDVDGI